MYTVKLTPREMRAIIAGLSYRKNFTTDKVATSKSEHNKKYWQRELKEVISAIGTLNETFEHGESETAVSESLLIRDVIQSVAQVVNFELNNMMDRTVYEIAQAKRKRDRILGLHRHDTIRRAKNVATGAIMDQIETWVDEIPF
jgi:cysteinyl-tRNA synthetase